MMLPHEKDKYLGSIFVPLVLGFAHGHDVLVLKLNILHKKDLLGFSLVRVSLG